VLLPTRRTAALAGALVLLALLAVAWPPLGGAVLALDLALAVAAVLDGLRVPHPRALAAARDLSEPLSAFAPNRVALELRSAASVPLRLEVADAPPPGFDSSGHRFHLRLPAGGSARVAYQVAPRSRGDFRFGDLGARAFGPWGLAARKWRLALSAPVRVYPDLRDLGRLAGARDPGAGRHRPGFLPEGQEFEGLRPHLPGDDVRRVDWKATARRGAPVVRELGPERSQTVWLLLDCGRPLAGRLPDGRTRLDGAVDACLALARSAARGGDRVGLLAFGAEFRALVPPRRGSSQLGPVAAALHALEPRPEESDLSGALDLLEAKQVRRALLVLLTDVADPESAGELVTRAARLRRRHLLSLVSAADPDLTAAASARPRSAEDAYARIAAERILAERRLALRRLRAAGIRVDDVPPERLAEAAVSGYLAAKGSGRL